MKRTLFLLVGLLCAARVDAARICLAGATGSCDSTVANSAAGMTSALSTAVQGDTIVVPTTANLVGHYTLAAKSGTTGITITIDDLTQIPAAGTRLTAANAGTLPTFQSDTTSDPVFRAAPGAHNYTFIGLKFKSNPGGYGDVLAFGTNDCDVSFCQEFASQEPNAFTVDRLLFVADAVTGQKRFIEFGGTNLTVKNSSFYGTAAFGQDSQCIGGVNGHGPWTITNNYCEAAGENIMFGGDDARIRTVMTVTGTPTTTSASVAVSVGSISGVAHSLSELAVGDHLAIAYAAGTQRCHTTLRSLSGTTSGTITFDACPAAPDVPGDIRAGVTPKGLTVQRNWLAKPLAWLNPIINAPTNVSAVPNTASGSLAAGSYQYTVIALNTGGYTGQTEVSSSQTVTCTLTATGKCTVNWAQPSNASDYRVYGRTSAGVTLYLTLSNASCSGGLCSLDDTGAAGTAATSVTRPSYWQIKNCFELKAGQSVQVDSNVCEYEWAGADQGTAMWIKSNNQGNGAEFNWSKDIIVEKNIIRHVDGCLTVSGREFYTGNAVDAPGTLTNFTFRNNLCVDSGSTWALSAGGTTSSQYAIILASGCDNCVIDHNTLIDLGKGFAYFTSGTYNAPKITNNLGLKNTYGIFCDQGNGEGNIAGCPHVAGAWSITANAIAGITASVYPAGNFGPSVATWQAQFTNFTADGAPNANGAADYTLLPSSLYHNAGTDGKDLGADIAAVLAATSGVTSGSITSVSNPPSVTTSSLPNGTVNSAYTATVSGQGTGAITFTLQAGTLPNGLSLASSGAITGTPTLAGTSSFTVRATDAGTGLTADAVLGLTIDPSFTNVSITTGATLPGAVLGQGYTTALAATGGKAPFSWAVTGGALPDGVTLDAPTGTVSGTPTATGTFTPTLTVTGALGTASSRTFSITVLVETMPVGRQRAYNSFFEGASFIRPSCPTIGVRKGDHCSDISGAKARDKIATSVSPSVVWEDVSAAANSHNLLSATHPDTFVETPQDGDLLVYTSGVWRRFPLCSAGAALGSDGTRWGCVENAAQQSTSTSSPAGGTPYSFHTRTSSSTPWTNMELATQELFGTAGSPSVGNRVFANLTGKTQAYLYARVSAAGVSGSKMWVQYSTDETTWADLDSAGTTVLTLNPSGNKTVGPFVITPAARARVYLRVVGSGGDAAADPTFGNIQILVE